MAEPISYVTKVDADGEEKPEEDFKTEYEMVDLDQDFKKDDISGDVPSQVDDLGQGTEGETECDETSQTIPRNVTQSSFTVERNVYTQESFDEEYDGEKRPSRTIKERWSATRSRCECSGKCVKKKVFGFLPFIPIMMSYTLEDLFYDSIAGLTVSVLQIPQGMAYALLANVDPVYGLYTCFYTVLIYYFFGTSRHVNVGTFAVVSLMVGSAVTKVCGSDETDEDMTTYAPSTVASMLDPTGTIEHLMNTTTAYESDELVHGCNIQAATAVTFVCGCIQLLMGFTRLGIVVIYLSEPLTRGFTTGAAIHVFSSQLKYVFGVEVGSYSGAWKLLYTYRDLFLALPDTNWYAFGLSCVCMIIIFVTKEYINPHVKRKIKAPIPIDLIIVLGTAIWCYYGEWEEKYGLEVVGDIPTGFPAPAFPPTEYMADLVGDAIAIAIVAFAISISMSQLFANKYNYKVDANQELLAHGICNTVASCFYCYVTCVSLSRSVVQENLGCRSQVAGLFCCLVILLVLLWLAPLFEPLPEAVLGAVVIVALKGMFMQFADLKTLWPINKTDWVVWMFTFIAVVLFDVAIGLVFGVAFELLTVIGKTQMPYCAIEGRVPDTDIYRDKKVYGKAEDIPGIVIFRFEGSMYFANTRHFMDRLYRRSGCHPKKLRIAQVKVMEKKANAEEATAKHEKKCQQAEEQGKASPEFKKQWDVELATGLEIPRTDIHHIIIDCTTMGYMDSQAVTTLITIARDYKLVDVKLFLAGCKGGIRSMLVKGGFFNKNERETVFPAVHDAVVAALEDHPEQREQMKVTTVTLDPGTYAPDKEDSEDFYDEDEDEDTGKIDQPPLDKYDGTAL